MVRAIFLIVVSFFSCKCQKEASTKQDTIDSKVLTVLVEDDFFLTDTLETFVVKEAKALNAFFNKVNKTRKPGIPVPIINFKEEMVLIVCAGKRQGLRKLSLTEGAVTDTNLVIHIIEESENPKNSSVSYPFSVYKIPVTEKQVLFQYD